MAIDAPFMAVVRGQTGDTLRYTVKYPKNRPLAVEWHTNRSGPETSGPLLFTADPQPAGL